jgi:heme/copper-type cytochrome/quinol oxidase subunit 3
MSAWENFDEEVGTNSSSDTPLYGSLLWLVTLAGAWLLFVFTAQPTIGILAACSKFGWQDVWTSIWLRSHDPDEKRGRTCSWFYLALGLWKVAVTAGAAMLSLIPVLAILEATQPQAQQPSDLVEIFGIVALEALGGLILSAVITYLAFFIALRRRCRVWIDQSVARARRKRMWPPTEWTKNRAGALLITSLITLLVASVIILICVIAQLGGKNARAQQQADFLDIVAIILGLAVMTVGAGFVLCLRDLAQRIVIAQDPRECWGPFC